MKQLYLYLVTPLLLTSCFSSNTSTVDKKEPIALPPSPRDDRPFVLVHKLSTKENVPIGDVYVKIIDEDLFTDLLVLNSNKDTLYEIKHNVFRNSRGIDITVPDEDFYGYRFVSKHQDYFTVVFLENGGKDLSDNIVLKWKYDKNLIEVLKTP